MRILVVDDEEIIRSVARKILERNGHDILMAGSGEEALQVARISTRKPELALVDLTMAGLSGAETVHRLRELIPGLPVIISSGHAVEELHMPRELLRLTHFLQKPYRAKELVSAVQRASDHKEE